MRTMSSGGDEVAAVEHRLCPARTHQRQAAARARAHGNARPVARRTHDAHGVVEDHRVERDRGGAGLHRDDLGGAHHSADAGQVELDGAPPLLIAVTMRNSSSRPDSRSGS
jgi:hypothetical protein